MAETPNPPTRPLRASANPQARMQELLRRESPTQPQEETTTTEDTDTTALPDSSATSSAVVQASGSADGSVVDKQSDTAKEDGKPPQPARMPGQKRHAESPKAKSIQVSAEAKDQGDATDAISSAVARTTSSAVGSATGSNPVHDAMRAMLALPYPLGMESGMMTVTTVKIPKPLWERLEYARTLTKKDKQDIIAAALRLYFEQIVEGNVK